MAKRLTERITTYAVYRTRAAGGISKKFGLVVALALVICPAWRVYAQGSATYEVVFEASWSSLTHPDGFPSNPHFSGLIGTTHDSSVSFWSAGELASPGIQRMAETGSKTTLRQEIQASSGVGALLDGGGISLSPGSTRLVFQATEDDPLVTLVSMLAPSPDWFVGVSGLDLRENGQWLASVSVDLLAYDAGTDSGVRYGSANRASNPHVAVHQIDVSPFLVDGSVPPVAKFTFTLQSGTHSEELPTSPRLEASIYPNPIASRGMIDLTIPQDGTVEIDLLDITGRRVHTVHRGYHEAGQFRLSVQVSGLSPGVYVARIRSAGGILAAPLIVSN